MSEKSFPATWTACRFDAVAKVISGKNQKEVESSSGAFPIYGSGGSFGRATTYLCEAGTTVIGRKGTINSPIFVNERFWNVDTAFGLYPIDCDVLGPRLLYYFCRSFNFKALDKSTTIPSLAKRDIEAITIPLPPLPEQKRIVAKIEELFSEMEAGDESLRLARRQLGVYRQSLLKQAFAGQLTAKWRTQNRAQLESPVALLARIDSERLTRYESQLASRSGAKSKKIKPSALKPFPAAELVGNFALPADWLVVSYGDLCSLIRNGISQKPSGDTGHKIARISAVRPMVFDYGDYRFLDCDDEFAADYTLVAGDLIFTRYNGARRFVGVCAQFKGREPRLYPDKLIRTRPDLPTLDPRYLEIALNCGLSRAWLETKIRTTAGQSGVSGGDVKAMPVPLCSLPEQQEIVRLLDAQFEVIERNEREIDGALRQSEALRQSILKKAFTGRLVPQVATDEPATELLARLRAEPEKSNPSRSTSMNIITTTNTSSTKSKSTSKRANA